MLSLLMITIAIIGCIALRSKGLWDKKVKDLYKLDTPDVQASEIRVSTIVKAIVYTVAIAMFPVIGIGGLIFFEILPWAFTSKK